MTGISAGGSPGPLVYIGAELPKLSETFVYRELLGLRKRGWSVIPVTVRRAAAGLEDPGLASLSAEALVAYCWQAVFAPLFVLIYPGVFVSALVDAASDDDLRPMQRLKVLVQACVSLQIAWRLRKSGVTHIHAHMAHVPTSFAMYLARALGVPFSFTGHAADLFVDRQMLSRKLGAASFVVCISHWHREFYRSLNSGQSRFPVIRCGVDIDEFRPVAASGDASQLNLLAVGRLVEKKGFDILIEALSLSAGSLADDVPFQVNIVGGGPQESRLKADVDRLGLGRRVTFSGERQNRFVRQALAECDIFVLPCRKADDGDMDGIPVALMEAMASGVCVISGRLPAIEELVEHEKTGMLVPAGNSAALAEVLSRLSHDTELRCRLAAAGRRRVEQEFSSQVNLDRLEQCFNMLTDGD